MGRRKKADEGLFFRQVRREAHPSKAFELERTGVEGWVGWIRVVELWGKTGHFREGRRRGSRLWIVDHAALACRNEVVAQNCSLVWWLACGFVAWTGSSVRHGDFCVIQIQEE